VQSGATLQIVLSTPVFGSVAVRALACIHGVRYASSTSKFPTETPENALQWCNIAIYCCVRLAITGIYRNTLEMYVEDYVAPRTSTRGSRSSSVGAQLFCDDRVVIGIGHSGFASVVDIRRTTTCAP